MKKNDKYNYVRGSRTMDHGSRTYQVDGFNLPSVTTILSRTKDQSILTKWRNKVGHEEAERIFNLNLVASAGLACISSWRNISKTQGTRTLRRLASKLSRWLKRLLT